MKKREPRPVVRHTKSSRDKHKLQSLVTEFMNRRVKPLIMDRIHDLSGKWDDPEKVLEFRRQLRDEVNAALKERDDRFYHFIKTGEVTAKGHEPAIALLAAIIDYHIDEHLRERVNNLYG